MKRHTEHVLVLVAVAVVVAIGLGIFVYSGIYNIGADDHHTKPVFAVLQTLRNRSIHVRSDDIKVPNLEDPQLILKGAGQYAAMCTGCHLRPGMEDSELRKGMYPQPPNLSKVHVDPQDAFWVIKHGIKMSAMPAWGLDGSHDDQTIWSMVAFLEKLPGMTPQQYKAIVAKAPPDEDMDMGDGGHSHSHGDDGHDDDHAAPSSGMPAMKPGAAPAAEAVAQAFQDALKQGDRAKALALLAPDAQISEGGETQNAEEYAAHHLGEDIGFLKDARVALLSRVSMTMGDTAQVVSESEIEATRKGRPLTLRSHEQMDLKRVDGSWKIVAIHWRSQRTG